MEEKCHCVPSEDTYQHHEAAGERNSSSGSGLWVYPEEPTTRTRLDFHIKTYDVTIRTSNKQRSSMWPLKLCRSVGPNCFCPISPEAENKTLLLNEWGKV